MPPTISGLRRACLLPAVALATAGPAFAQAVEPVVALAPAAERLDTVEVQGNYLNGVGSSDAASQGTVDAKLIETPADAARRPRCSSSSPA